MKRQSETRPETLQPAEGGVMEFNFNVAATGGGYEYDSVDVVGEPARVNIKYAMMLERYTDEQINEMENVKRHSEDAEERAAYEAYKAVKDGFDAVISAELGNDYE